MKFRVEELAAVSGERVDTIRYYQAQGLLPRPRRQGRIALYGDAHLQRLRRIRRYQSQGLSLAVIKKLFATRGRSKMGALLEAVAEESGERSLTRNELAQRIGLPSVLLASLEAAGLLTPVKVDGEPRYGETDVKLLTAGLDILREGFPLHELLPLAIRHHQGTGQTIDHSIELFDRFVRRAGEEEADPETIADAFRRLFPLVTAAVALHFQRTLLSRALARLRERGEEKALAAAREVVDAGRLEVDVEWRARGRGVSGLGAGES